jgi:hypothetical protein
MTPELKSIANILIARLYALESYHEKFGFGNGVWAQKKDDPLTQLRTRKYYRTCAQLFRKTIRGLCYWN